MAITLHVRNFRGIAGADLSDRKQLSLILGENEAGKSSLAAAIEYAFTGSAFGASGRGVVNLIRKGETKMKVEVQVGNHTIARTKTNGPTLREISEQLGVDTSALPLLFNSASCIESGKTLAKFFQVRTEAGFDYQLLCKDSGEPTEPAELFDEKPTASKGSAALASLFEEIIQAVGSRPKDIVARAEEKRAGCRPPSAPAQPTVPRPESIPDADGEQIKTLSGDLFRTRTAQAALKNALDLLPRCAAYLTALASYNAGTSAKGDGIAERRPHLAALVSFDESSLLALGNTLEALGNDRAVRMVNRGLAQIERLRQAAQDELTAHPLPKAAPRLSDATGTFLKGLADQTLVGVQAELNRAQAEEARLSAEEIRFTREISKVQEETAAARAAMQAWSTYDKAKAEYGAQAAEATRRWNEWDQVAKLTQAEIQRLELKAKGSFLASLRSFSEAFLDGRLLSLSDEGEILLDELPLALLSDSARWRISVAIMAALALEIGSPLLVLDGADILDSRNREAMMGFLVEHIAPRFQHCIVLATPKVPVAELDPVPADTSFSRWQLSAEGLTAA